jgi:methylenetetrahydrofolate reductase (NADPH)
MQTQKHYPQLFSFEFYPPKTEAGTESLQKVHQKLARLQPDFFSVTFGAGGSTRDKTYETVIKIEQQGVPAAPHLSCVASTRENILDILKGYRDNGIKKIVALRGDLPSGMMSAGQFRYANELVEFIRAETGDYFQIHVAAYPETHPQARNANEDLKNFKRKVEAGVPGIMPITNYSQLFRFSDMCGADIPRWLRKKLECFGDDREQIIAFGLDVVTTLCQQLLDNGAPGLHFYTLNQAEPTLAILNNLDLPARS